VSYQVNWEIQALDLTAGFLSDDPAGVAALWESVSHLADEPRPPESFPYGSPDLRRLRAGQYRVLYTIDSQTKCPASMIISGWWAAAGPALTTRRRG
jgi:mRNA interferase RelE/StbE